MAQAVFCGIAHQAHLLGRDQFHIVYVLVLKIENCFYLFQIVPVRLHIEGPHESEDQAVVVCFGEFLKDHMAQLLDDVAPEGTEDL